jgi:signal transduction histidine kinase
MGYSEMLIATADDRRVIEVVRMLKKIHGAGETLLELINSVLDVAKLEAGKTLIHLEDVSVSQVAREAIDLVTPQAEAQGNVVKIELPSHMCVIHTDRTKLRQCLVNFLSNAAKFTHNGTITLSASASEDDVIFSVRDTGIGMSAEQLDTVFEAFQQADASIASRFGGTGLGLTISKEFCHMLGGDLRVKSMLGQGSEFQMRIPSRVHAKPRAQATSQVAPAHGMADPSARAQHATGPTHDSVHETPDASPWPPRSQTTEA